MRNFAVALKLSSLLGWLTSDLAAVADDKSLRPAEGIMDNSFLIEEAYNQPPGVVQHIFNAVYGMNELIGPETHALNLSFTQEWPVFSQTHQFSYTVPYGFLWNNGVHSSGWADVLLNYRYQAYFDQKSLTAFAPRFTLVLPTGSVVEGFHQGVLGYQWGLPFSTALGDRWFLHANAGVTFLPRAVAATGEDFLRYSLGASAIYCVSPRFNLMLEWIGNWSEAPGANGALAHEFSSVISPGFRYAINFQNGSQLVLGLAVPLGLTGSAPQAGAFVYLSFESQLFGKKDAQARAGF
jgi:hypothetical protein